MEENIWNVDEEFIRNEIRDRLKNGEGKSSIRYEFRIRNIQADQFIEEEYKKFVENNPKREKKYSITYTVIVFILTTLTILFSFAAIFFKTDNEIFWYRSLLSALALLLVYFNRERIKNIV